MPRSGREALAALREQLSVTSEQHPVQARASSGARAPPLHVGDAPRE
jgi:hypothetical protein